MGVGFGVGLGVGFGVGCGFGVGLNVGWASASTHTSVSPIATLPDGHGAGVVGAVEIKVGVALDRATSSCSDGPPRANRYRRLPEGPRRLRRSIPTGGGVDVWQLKVARQAGSHAQQMLRRREAVGREPPHPLVELPSKSRSRTGRNIEEYPCADCHTAGRIRCRSMDSLLPMVFGASIGIRRTEVQLSAIPQRFGTGIRRAALTQ